MRFAEMLEDRQYAFARARAGQPDAQLVQTRRCGYERKKCLRYVATYTVSPCGTNTTRDRLVTPVKMVRRREISACR